MTTKNAKSDFTKAEIVDILKTNVDLYKDEPEFPNYIINLSLYLFGQIESDEGLLAEGLDSLLFSSVSGTSKGSKNGIHQIDPRDIAGLSEDETSPGASGSLTSLLELENQSLDESGEFESKIEELPVPDAGPNMSGFDKLLEIQQEKRKSLQDSQFEPVMKAPGMESDKADSDAPEEDASLTEPPSDVEFHEPKTDKLNVKEIEEIQRQTRDESLMLKMENTPLLDVPVKQLRSTGQMTPLPTGGLSKKERVSPPSERDGDEKEHPTGQLGRAQVYKVVRTYKQKKDSSDRCPACNAYTRGRSICPSCGHIL